MRFSALLLAAALGACAPAHATPARLSVWATTSPGLGNGEVCRLDPAGLAASGVLATEPTLTERDVLAWDRERVTWTLDPISFAGLQSAFGLQDRCFVIAIDGRALTSGIILASHSARLTTLPTLALTYGQDRIKLMLTAGHGGYPPMPAHAEALDGVLRRPANLAQRVELLPPKSAPAEVQRHSDEWAAAVRQLLADKTIIAGMSFQDLIGHLGRPNIVPRGYSGVYTWRFEDLRPSLTRFEASIHNDTVVSINLTSPGHP